MSYAVPLSIIFALGLFLILTKQTKRMSHPPGAAAVLALLALGN